MLHLNDKITQIEEEGAFAVSDRAMALKAQGNDVINLGIGQPDFTPPAHILEAAAKAAIDGPHGYTSPVGLPQLRDAIAALAGPPSNCRLESDQVVIVPGGKVTIYFAAVLFAAPGAQILYPNPGFPPYREAIRSAGATPVPYPIRQSNNFALDVDEVLSLITPQTSLLIVNSPANPTGGALSHEQLEKLAEGLADHPHVAVLSDEIYSRLSFDANGYTSFLSFDHMRDRTIILNGWSKTFAMTGWRLGYGIWPLHLVPHVRKLITVDHSCVNGVAQMAGLAAVTGPMAEIDGFVVTFKQRRDFVVERLNAIAGISCAMPAGAFYAFPDVTASGWDSGKLANQFLEKAHVATIAGESFGDNGKGFLRISYAASMSQLARALDRLEDFLDRHQPVK